IKRLIDRLLQSYPEDGYSNPSAWPVCAQLTPHLLTLQDSQLEEMPQARDWASLLMRAGGDLHRRAAHLQGKPLMNRALAIRERLLGPHPETAATLNNLALLVQDQGDLAAARPLYEAALAIREASLGPASEETAASLNNLALLLQTQGQFDSA